MTVMPRARLVHRHPAVTTRNKPDTKRLTVINQSTGIDILLPTYYNRVAKVMFSVVSVCLSIQREDHHYLDLFKNVHLGPPTHPPSRGPGLPPKFSNMFTM